MFPLFATGVVDTGGNYRWQLPVAITGGNDTGGKSAAGIVNDTCETGGKSIPVCTLTCEYLRKFSQKILKRS
jgi:hypothetical protein